MTRDELKTCIECKGTMAPVVIMDKTDLGTRQLEYHLPDDRMKFGGRYPTATPVRAFMCSQCGRISMYGDPSKVKLADSLAPPRE